MSTATHDCRDAAAMQLGMQSSIAVKDYDRPCAINPNGQGQIPRPFKRVLKGVLTSASVTVTRQANSPQAKQHHAGRLRNNWWWWAACAAAAGDDEFRAALTRIGAADDREVYVGSEEDRICKVGRGNATKEETSGRRSGSKGTGSPYEIVDFPAVVSGSVLGGLAWTLPGCAGPGPCGAAVVSRYGRGAVNSCVNAIATLHQVNGIALGNIDQDATLHCDDRRAKRGEAEIDGWAGAVRQRPPSDVKYCTRLDRDWVESTERRIE